MRGLVTRIVRSLAIAAIPVANLVCFATFAIFAGNAREFAGSYPDLIAIILPYGLLLTAALAVPGLLLKDPARPRYESLLCALAVLLWVQGNILVWNYGVFDGRSINWLDGAWRGIVDTALWLAVLLLAVYRYEQVGRGLQYAAVATVLIQTVSVAVELNEQPQVLESRDIAANIDGREAAMRFSPSKNIVHILMDGFQSDIFAGILADTSERDFKSELRGFTYFDKHLGAYPYTQLTLPAMLSGRLFYNDMPVDDFVKDVLQGPTILNSAHNAGYEVDIVAPVPLKNIYAMGTHSNALGVAANGHVTAGDIATIDAARLVDLALFRVLPHFGKALVHRDELWVFQAKVQNRSYMHLQYFSDLAFLQDLADEMTVDRSTPVYKMIHVMLSHRPIVGNDRCEFDGRKAESRKTVTTHSRCGFIEVLNVLQRMKDLGIYDSSLIILMADHGAWVPVDNFDSSLTIGPMSVGMATPVLAIKPPQATQPFQVSGSPSAITDVAATIADLAAIDSNFDGSSVFDIAEDAMRERTHLTYGYGVNPAAKGYLFPMQEWVVNGDPYQPESWTKRARHLPKE